MGFFDQAPTQHTVLNLGAGVQSSTLALMIAKGEVNYKIDFAVFADTQVEPKEVYAWLDYLESILPFPVVRVTKGNMTDEMLVVHTSQKKGTKWSKSLIPAFMKKPEGSVGLLGRQCTFEYKIKPILREIRKRCGIKRGQKTPSVTQLIGISADEVHRMKPARDKWTQHAWPLVELGMSRRDCLNWMKRNGYPEPPRSACVYCPFHSDNEWQRIKTTDPEGFALSVDLEKNLQVVKSQTEHNKAVPWLHRSCLPLDEVDFSKNKESGQMDMFGNECEGLCGV